MRRTRHYKSSYQDCWKKPEEAEPSNLDWRVAVVIALVQSMGTVVWGPDRGEAVSLVRQD